MCHYFDEMIELVDFDLDDILIDEKSHALIVKITYFENTLTYHISYKTLIDPKPLSIRFDKINGFIGINDGNKYLTMFDSEKYSSIYNRIR